MLTMHVEPPSDATEDERRILERYALPQLTPTHGEEPEVVHYLEPQSGQIERFDLFELAPALFREFAVTPMTLVGVKAFAEDLAS